MDTQFGLDKCAPFIASQWQPNGSPGLQSKQRTARLAVTISRQSGSGAHAVGELLAKYLQARAPNDFGPWTVFDRNLVEKVLEDHDLPRRFARFMPEDRISEVAETMDELLGVRPPSSLLVRQTAETILRLAEEGNVILIGRGANLITSKLEHVLHVRLIGSLAKRVQHIREIQKVGEKEALAFIRNEDRGRRRYLKKHFDSDLEDPLLYHLVINTDLVSYENAAHLIGDTLLIGLHRSVERPQERRVA